MAISAKERAGRNLPLSTKGGQNENVYAGYHESSSSQAKSGRIYDLLHKIMAAEIMANEKQSQRHKIGRSGVVSKYVGKTEKRLNKTFFKAWPSNMMLFLGGAEVLMGKPSMVNHGGATS